jgi:NADPH:quinone reductase
LLEETAMKAAWYERKGPAREVLQVGERPMPEPISGEVRVRIRMSAVNPSDTKNRGGHRGNVTMPFPAIVPHQDGAGIVEAVGAGVDPGRVGERVWVYEATLGRAHGTAAEYTVVPARKAVRLPDDADFAAGACMGIPAMTAHRCVFADGSIAGRNVLVHGGAGAVGYYAVQMARLGGAARVIATVSREEQAKRALEVGAHEVINRRDGNLVERIRQVVGPEAGVDRVIEVAFGENLASNLAVMAPNGVIATYASDAVPEPQVPFWPMLAKDLTVRFVLVYAMSAQAHDEAAAWICDALERGLLKHQVHRVFALEDIVAAHEATESMTNVGKVLVRID